LKRLRRGQAPPCQGCKRFLDRIWNLAETRIPGDDSYSGANESAVHRAIKKVGDDIESMKFNTAIATLMALVNAFYEKTPSRGDIKALLTLLSPFAPHIAEELWEIQGFAGLPQSVMAVRRGKDNRGGA
jgi:leucyl-tRNA synthetase